MKTLLQYMPATLRRIIIVLIVSVLSLQLTMPLVIAQEITSDDIQAIATGTENYDPKGECVADSGAVINTTGQVKNVYVLGDSITRAAKTSYETKFTAKGATATVNGLDSRTIADNPAPSGLEAVDQDKDAISRADVVVIALGTNSKNFTNENVAALIDKIRDPNGINSQAKIYWVDIVNFSNLQSTKAVNTVIYGQSVPKQYSIISWFKAVNPGDPQNPADTNDEKQYLSGDKVHLSNGGNEALSSLVVDTVTGSAFSSTTPAPTQPPASGETTGTLTLASNTGYNGEQIWSTEDLQTVQQHRPFYEKAAQKANIPWAMLAVVHKHEYGLKRENPSNGQGIYQDFARENGPYPAGPVSDEEFQRQTDWAAQLMRRKADANPEGLRDLTTPDGVKETFWGYNGKASAYRQQAAGLGFDPDRQGFEGSPYVMNKADARRDPATAAPGTWGQIKRDRGGIEYPANNHFGAWVMYSALAGVSGGATSTSGGCGNTGVATNGPTAGSPSAQLIIDIARREMQAGAKESDRSFHKYTMGRTEAWCADFVSWVLREAGTPFTGGRDGWNIAAVSGVKAWFEKNGEYNPKGTYMPRPGDVVIMKNGVLPYRSHVTFVVAVNGDEITTIGGNESDTIKERTHNRNAAYITGYGTKVK